jgi:hypothetical protein
VKQFHSYTFTVLRYIHDVTTGEFVNVGIVLFCREQRFLGARTRTTYGRLTRLFPDADGESFKKTMAHIERAVWKAAHGLTDLFPTLGRSAVDFARAVLPHDDGSLQWSPEGSGRTEDLESELELLFDRFVLRYEKPSASESRSDEDVWKSFSRALESRNILPYLRDKEIASDVERITFRHAWKNNIWHCLEPVSFDLVEGESIHQKALRWVGQMAALSGSSERFKLYMLIGEPRHVAVQEHYTRALRILQQRMPGSVVFTEAQADELSSLLEREIAEHERRIQ